MSDRIVIHRRRTPRPDGTTGGRWFTYDGRVFDVMGDEPGSGFGYEVTDQATGTRVADGYFYLSDITDNFPDDYAAWAEEHL